MKRSDFLAIIPSLSAIPFIGKDIVQKSDRIEIFQPEQVKQEVETLYNTEVLIVRNGKTVARGHIESFTVDAPLNESTQTRFQGIIYNQMSEDLWFALHEVAKPQLRYNAKRSNL